MYRRNYRITKGKRNDGLKELAIIIKAKAKDLINRFKSYPFGKKIAVILLDVIALISAKDAFESHKQLVPRIKKLKKYQALLNKLEKAYSTAVEQGDPDFMPNKDWVTSKLQINSRDLLVDGFKLRRLIGLISMFISLALRAEIGG